MAALGGGYRLDHLIVSAEVTVPVCGYLHEWRDEGLSDHSPLVAHVTWASRAVEPAAGRGER